MSMSGVSYSGKGFDWLPQTCVVKERIELSEEEEKMVIALRNFKMRAVKAATFQWHTHPNEEAIVTPGEFTIIVDPACYPIVESGIWAT